MEVVVSRTFLELRPVSDNCLTRPRAFSDSGLCFQDDDSASTVADSDASETCSNSAQWDCDELELDLTLDEVSSVVPSPTTTTSSTASPSAVLPPPGVFTVPNRALLGRVASQSPKTPTIETRTTLMLRNLPNAFTRAMLCATLDLAGFERRYDFVYMPVDFQSGAGLGYAFINMLSGEDAKGVLDILTGFCAWGDAACHKVLEIRWSDPQQGLQMLVERFRNSRIMHRSVPDEYKPMMLAHGEQVAFPPPSKRLRSPM